ncbi:hypothetical protein [Knoellia sinensis]|nr:hypothetical protein [Knoellia sinensis]
MTDPLKIYRSVDEVNADATLVVRARATSRSWIETVRSEKYPELGVQFTVRSFAVSKVLRGDDPGASIDVRELGVETDRGTTVSETDYILFLHEFGFEKGTQYKNQWTGVGGPVGVMVVDGQTTLRSSDEFPEMPSSIPLRIVEAAAGRVASG